MRGSSSYRVFALAGAAASALASIGSAIDPRTYFDRTPASPQDAKKARKAHRQSSPGFFRRGSSAGRNRDQENERRREQLRHGRLSPVYLTGENEGQVAVRLGSLRRGDARRVVMPVAEFLARPHFS